MAEVHTEVKNLDIHFHALQQQWQASRSTWHDSIAQQFESRYWYPLAKATKRTLDEMAQLAQVIQDARRHVR